MSGVQETVTQRRRIAIEALGRELDGADPSSSAARLGRRLANPRPLAVSADIDGIVSAAMLASVAATWDVVALVVKSERILVHPSVASAMPADLVAVDLFSLKHDSISNHVVKYGAKQPRLANLSAAWRRWDAAVDAAATQRLMAVPSIWAGTQGCYEDADKATSSKYKYPLGTAQLVLALLEAAGHPPRFYDRDYLPWLLANCDGGVSTYTKHSYNARVWWPVLAGAVGPASLTEQVFRLVDGMRPHDFHDKVNALDRERQARREKRWLNDQWNLADERRDTLARTLQWICDLTGWRDPLRGGIGDLGAWVEMPLRPGGLVEMAGITQADEARKVQLIDSAVDALNANFYMGGFGPGSRFNWIGGW